MEYQKSNILILVTLVLSWQ